MSVITKLYYDDKQLNVIEYRLAFKQEIDHSGKPSTKPQLKGLYVKVEYPQDSEILDWMITPSLTKQLQLKISSAIIGKKTRTIEFIDAHCVGYKEQYKEKDSYPITIDLEITSGGVIDGATEYSEYWRKTYPTDNTSITTREAIDTSPEFITSYYVDENGNKISAPTLGETVFLIAESKNMIGETVDIELGDLTGAFEYNGSVLTQKTLENIVIDSNTMKIKLKAVNPLEN
ncbi:type VI secretion system tube protein TssD [Aquimarina hainanensis]|uniref:Type VI secretion system tube protein TssD n=1 Tax=Aquimarina hainanensis TaxID=1578017 RepID=A0ABW5N2L4_9FLAO|nr:type VI secretion system tube protein TssD [Aquimarina sp. TRL1]QKX05798.1 hypothetical protein HN014_13070 [Aquimarina sp. TRL1]